MAVRVLCLLAAAAAVLAERDDLPAGQPAIPDGHYCGSVGVLAAQERLLLWVRHEERQFDFHANGLAFLPFCPGNDFKYEVNAENGRTTAVPDMTAVTPCLKHEMRHLSLKDGDVPIIVEYLDDEAKTLNLRVQGVPILGEASVHLTQAACKEMVTPGGGEL